MTSIRRMRQRIGKDSDLARECRRPASPGRLLLYSVLAVLATAAAARVYLAGNELTAMGTLAVAATLAAEAWSNWRRLGSEDGS